VRLETMLLLVKRAWKNISNCGSRLSIDFPKMAEYRGSRKARASVLAVDERQKLETLTRDEKTANRTLVQLSERQQGLEEKITVRKNDLTAQAARKEEVC